MSGQIRLPAHFRSALLWIVFLGICLPLAGQIPINRYDFLNRRGKKESSNLEPFYIHVNITDLNGNKAQAFDESKGIVLDFDGAEKGLVNITINFPPKEDYKLILRKACLTATPNLVLTGPYSLKGKDQEFSTEQKIQYQAIDNGKFEFKVNYYVLHNDLNPVDFDCDKAKNYITFTGEIKGIAKEGVKKAEPATPELDCAKVIAENRENCSLLLEMIRTNSACIFEARDALFAYKEELYKKCLDGKSLEACQAFLECDPRDSRAGAVKRKSQEFGNVEDTGKMTEDKARWREIEKAGDYKVFREFYAKFPDSRFRAMALDSLAKYYPWAFSLVEKEGNRRVYRIDSIQFVKNLRWKDVSPLPGLEINAANLPIDGRVEVTFSELGNYLIYFRDGYGRQDSISFSTQLKGTLKPGKKNYMVYFEGGTPPYHVELVDIGQNKTVKSYPSVKTDSFAISMEDVKALDLPHLKVWIQDASRIRVSAEGDILLENPLNLLKIAAYALVVLLSLLVIYLVTSFYRRRNRKNIQIEEA